jgi:4-hydroxybenzoate polyprenyltransferase
VYYVGGMYLNDAFDHRIDMGACRVMIYVAGAYAVRDSLSAGVLWGAAMLLCYLIGLTYAAKQEALNRLTRVWPLGFVAAPAAYGVWLAAQVPLVWPFLVGFVVWVLYALSFLRSGTRRSVPQAVVRLIAGIALLDATLIASTGATGWAVCAASFCAITRLFQRVIPGT